MKTDHIHSVGKALMLQAAVLVISRLAGGQSMHEIQGEAKKECMNVLIPALIWNIGLWIRPLKCQVQCKALYTWKTKNP